MPICGSKAAADAGRLSSANLARRENRMHEPTQTPPATTRVLIVDDHPIVREGLALRIGRQPDMQVCGEAEGVADALRRVAELQPDIAVIDISLKAGNGLDLVK